MNQIAVVNMKGGVGKTTTAVHLAAGCAAHGRRVLLVDVDPQGTVAQILGVSPRRTLSDVMLGASAAEAIAEGVRTNLDVLVSTPAAFTLDAQLAGAVRRETILRRALRPLASRYDLVVLDTSPAMGLLTFNALLCATALVMPISMEPMAVVGARQTLDESSRSSRCGPNIHFGSWPLCRPASPRQPTRLGPRSRRSNRIRAWVRGCTAPGSGSVSI